MININRGDNMQLTRKLHNPEAQKKLEAYHKQVFGRIVTVNTGSAILYAFDPVMSVLQYCYSQMDKTLSEGFIPSKVKRFLAHKYLPKAATNQWLQEKLVELKAQLNKQIKSPSLSPLTMKERQHELAVIEHALNSFESFETLVELIKEYWTEEYPQSWRQPLTKNMTVGDIIVEIHHRIEVAEEEAREKNQAFDKIWKPMTTAQLGSLIGLSAKQTRNRKSFLLKGCAEVWGFKVLL